MFPPERVPVTFRIDSEYREWLQDLCYALGQPRDVVVNLLFSHLVKVVSVVPADQEVPHD